jgi:hypothetical protein
MPSHYLNNWIQEIQEKIDYWNLNFPLVPNSFAITPLPSLPVLNSNILSHDLTSCCPTPPKSPISFAHFPEPYYGDPDDFVSKSAVVLFFNPGDGGVDQLHGNVSSANTFCSKYNQHQNNYFDLARNYNFCRTTVNSFIIPKTRQLNVALSFIHNISDKKPLFMDLIPWHSKNFNGLDLPRFSNPNTIAQAKKMVFIPAILNAMNTEITAYLSKFSKNKIVLICVGAKYSKESILSTIGFKDITSNIRLVNNPFPNLAPPNLPYTILSSNNDIIVDSISKMKIWKVSGSEFVKDIELDQESVGNISSKEIIVINVWNMMRSMDIPQNIGLTLDHILQNI